MDIFCNYVYAMSSFRIICIGFLGIFRIKKAEVKNSKTETVEVSKCHCSECHKKSYMYYALGAFYGIVNLR